MLLLIKRILSALLSSVTIYLIIYGLQNWIINNLDYIDDVAKIPSGTPNPVLRIFNRSLPIPTKLANFLKAFGNDKKIGPSLAIFKFMGSLIFDFGLLEALIQSLLDIANQNCHLPDHLPKVQPKLEIKLPVVDEVLAGVWETDLYSLPEQNFLTHEIKQKLLNSFDEATQFDGVTQIDNLQTCTKAILIIIFLFQWIEKVNSKKFNSLLRLLLELLKKGKLSKRVLKLLARYFRIKNLPVSLDLLEELLEQS